MRLTLVAAVLVVLTSCSLAERQPACPNPQSPRNIAPQDDPYDQRSRISIIKEWRDDGLVYAPRAGGPEQILKLCGAHYHWAPENDQGCLRDAASARSSGPRARAGDHVEVHTVYASKVKEGDCDFRYLDCCLEGPFLVLAEQLAVIAAPSDSGAAAPESWRSSDRWPGRQLAEWSGSTTGHEDVPGECKPPAQWSFRLDCNGQIDLDTLQQIFGDSGQEPRELQRGNRLSRDLTLVTPARPSSPTR